MKNLFPIIVLFLLSASSINLTKKSSESIAPASTITTLFQPTQDMILTKVMAAYSTGPHAVKFSCKQCHPTNDGVVTKELTWTDEKTGQAEAISKPFQLCIKCHTSQMAPSIAESPATLAHDNFDCTNCHDPHTGQASCTQSTCHFDIKTIIDAQIDQPEFHPVSGDPSSIYMCGGSTCHELASQVAASPVYHQPIHNNVPCFVCHDVSGLLIVRVGNKTWITVEESAQTTNYAGKAVVSHIIGSGAGCVRCHYYANPWGLIDILSDN